MMRSNQSAALRLTAITILLVGTSAIAQAQQQASSIDTPRPIHASVTTARSNTAAASAATTAASSTKPALVIADDAAARIEGEKRFRTNCGRCHMAPHKFAPRTMATVVRHMRVRAMITDEDMRLILQYVTQ